MGLELGYRFTESQVHSGLRAMLQIHRVTTSQWARLQRVHRLTGPDPHVHRLTHRLRSTSPQAHRFTSRLLTTRPVQIRRRFSQGPTRPQAYRLTAGAGLQAQAAVTDSQPVDSLIIIPFVVVVVVISLIIVWRCSADHLKRFPRVLGFDFLP